MSFDLVLIFDKNIWIEKARFFLIEWINNVAVIPSYNLCVAFISNTNSNLDKCSTVYPSKIIYLYIKVQTVLKSIMDDKM